VIALHAGADTGVDAADAGIDVADAGTQADADAARARRALDATAARRAKGRRRMGEKCGSTAGPRNPSNRRTDPRNVPLPGSGAG
jgi:hypothetical protein